VSVATLDKMRHFVELPRSCRQGPFPRFSVRRHYLPEAGLPRATRRGRYAVAALGRILLRSLQKMADALNETLQRRNRLPNRK
jgi:hypothetical protein